MDVEGKLVKYSCMHGIVEKYIKSRIRNEIYEVL
jgi:hypothetical protein